MIVDILRAAEYYFDVYPGLEAGFAFISDVFGTDIEDGEYEIDGRRVYAIVSSAEGVGEGSVRLEAHRKYIDIQVCLRGTDAIGWLPVDECTTVLDEYSEDKDIEFYGDEPLSWINLENNVFAIFFPHDAHAPLASIGKCRKVVVKVAYNG